MSTETASSTYLAAGFSVRTSHVHLIAGPTGTGKTEAAMGLAAAEGAPVVVADRIQCYEDLPATSARFTGPEASPRHHLGSRIVSDGDYPVDEAAHALLRLVRSLAGHHRYVVVEGGSISVLSRFADWRGRLPFRLTARVLRISDRLAYLDRLRARARRMIRDGMLDEFASAWRHREQRAFVASIKGVEPLVQWCRDNRKRPEDLAGLDFGGPETDELADLVARVHAGYGCQQESVFTRLLG